MLALLFFQLGTPVVPFSPFYLGVSLLKLNSRKKGTLIIMRLLGNLASFVYQKGGRGKLLRSVPLSRLTKTTSAEGEGSCTFAGPYYPNGWMSKLWSLFGIPIIIPHLIFRVPEKGP